MPETFTWYGTRTTIQGSQESFGSTDTVRHKGILNVMRQSRILLYKNNKYHFWWSLHVGRYYFIINKFLQLSSTFQINILAQQVPSRARKEPHKISEEGDGRSGHFAEEASLPSRLQTYFGLPQVRSTSCPSK